MICVRLCVCVFTVINVHAYYNTLSFLLMGFLFWVYSRLCWDTKRYVWEE